MIKLEKVTWKQVVEASKHVVGLHFIPKVFLKRGDNDLNLRKIIQFQYYSHYGRVMWNIQVFFKSVSFFKSLKCICCHLHTISHVYDHFSCEHITPRHKKKGQVSRVNGICDDDYGSDLSLKCLDSE